MSIGTSDNPSSWMYISKRLHVQFLPNDPQTWRVPTFWYVESGKPVLMYRLAPDVYAWLFRALDALGPKLTPEIVAEWNAVAGWAGRHLDAEECARATRAKPVELPPPCVTWESLEEQDRWIARATTAEADSKKAYVEWLERNANRKRFATAEAG